MGSVYGQSRATGPSTRPSRLIALTETRQCRSMPVRSANGISFATTTIGRPQPVSFAHRSEEMFVVVTRLDDLAWCCGKSSPFDVEALAQRALRN
jgi:hypothetical protein